LGGIYGQQKYLYTTKKSEISTKIAGICINSGGIFGGILWKKNFIHMPAIENSRV
jgi:hypothetical protein